MKRRLLILIVFIITLTGCSSEYNLEFSNNKIKENVVVTILDSDIPKQVENPVAEIDDRVTPFIEGDQYPFFDNEEIVYDKKVDKVGDVTTVTLDYEYSHDEFKESNVYQSCFENALFDINRNNYLLSFSGSFYCLYGDEITINIKTNNKVNDHNADKVSGNVYTWIINQDNVQETSIQMNISDQSKTVQTVLYVVIGIVFVLLVICGYIAYKKIKNRDAVNEI